MLKAHLRKKHTKSYWYVFLSMHFFMEPVIPAMTGSRVPIPCIKAVKKIDSLTEKEIRTF
jgi:ribosome-interacting GTPase 1